MDCRLIQGALQFNASQLNVKQKSHDCAICALKNSYTYHI